MATHAPAADDPRARGRRETLILVLATAAMLAPFLAKPPHVDDPLFVLAAQRIREAPLDPYGVNVNWYGAEEPLHAVAQNPPGASYLLALFGLAGGTVGMHVGFLLVAVAAVLGVRALARDVGAAPLFAGLLALGTPVFLVSATTLMCDVPMTALSVWAVVLWLRGLRGERRRLLFAGAALAALAALTKYYAVTLVPLFAVAALLHRRRANLWAPPLFGVAAVLAMYEAAMNARYGSGHLSAAAVNAAKWGKETPLFDRGLGGMVFAGGCVVPVLACAPLVLRRRAAIACAAGTVVLAGLALRRRWIGAAPIANAQGFRAALFAHAVVFLAAAAVSVAVVAAAVARRDGARAKRDPDAIVLALWVCGTVVFASFVNWTTNARSILPLMPPLAVLVARGVRGGRIARALALAPGAALSLVVAWGDARIAEAQVEAAQKIRALPGFAAGHVWFDGHWGFQPAMEAVGARPLASDASPVAAGDLVIAALNNTNVRVFTVEELSASQTLEIALHAPATTIDMDDGAGFYCSIWGPLPFALCAAPPERYVVSVATRAFDVAPPR